MRRIILCISIILILFMAITGCSATNGESKSNDPTEKELPETAESQEEDPSCEDAEKINEEERIKMEYTEIIPDYKDSRYKEIYLAGGCFWGVQAFIDNILGIEYTNVGYANGESDQTDYDSIKKTGHTETLYVVYDPDKIPLDELLGYFYEIIDPTSLNKQGNDVGTQYRSGIYYVNEKDKEIIETVTEKEQEKYDGDIVTEIQPLENYVLAEDYHQDYLDKNAGGYCHIDLSRIPKEKPRVVWVNYPRPSIEEIKEKLTDLQFEITQESATEPPFQNKYWSNKESGLYVDIVTGEPLFLSLHKYDSGSGWPSFTRPVQRDVITYYTDESLGSSRIEVRSRAGDSHLGHLFYDGPVKEGGLRYCINSGALDFIPTADLENQGYGDFKIFFE